MVFKCPVADSATGMSVRRNQIGNWATHMVGPPNRLASEVAAPGSRTAGKLRQTTMNPVAVTEPDWS
ncbi:unannotated protein [freshwater metagenome]|uniref:Unannotated protein n=1 Tax=freshwater metagenome TaxID=449393 RepID=A0A6J7NB65_9ZZZZ